MAAPLSADRLVAALKTEGVHVTERPGWRDHNRNTKGPWSNLNGIVIHHTAGTNSLNLCWTGMADLPGPLCHTHLAKNGTATMVGYGRANHAGTFAANAFNAMLNEAPTHPRPDSAEPVDANARTYGIEIENLGNGKDPYPAAQYDAAVRWAAALCRAHGWTANSVIGHKEGTRRKIDPSFDMNAFRTAVAARLAHGADWNPSTTTPPQEDDVALSDADKKWISDTVKTQSFTGVWKTDSITAPTDAADAKTNPTWQAQSILKDIQARVRANTAAEAAQTAAITKLAGLVGSNVDTAAVVAAVREEIRDAVVRVSVDINGTEA
ncbi:peptidoglycan recognition protein family protein [Streptomyces olivaceus]